jgi:hypothetical protein
MSSTVENPFPTLGGGSKNPGSFKPSPIKNHPLSILNKPAQGRYKIDIYIYIYEYIYIYAHINQCI